jgi:invasion protein IalB
MKEISMSHALRLSRRLPIVVSCILALAILGWVGGQAPVEAQTAKPAAKPPAKPKVAVKTKKGNWVKLCGKRPAPPAKAGGKPTLAEICSVQIEWLDPLGQLHVVARIAKVTGKTDQAMELSLPHMPMPIYARPKKKGDKPKQVGRRMSSFIVPAGIRIFVDGDKKAPIKLKFAACDPFGCLASGKADDAVVKKLKAGGKITIVAVDVSGVPVRYPTLPLTGFTAAYDGKPVDPKKFAAARKQLNATIKRNREIASKRMQAKRAAEKAAQGMVPLAKPPAPAKK